MTPHEQELVEELFDRLAKLENSVRDPDAERLIADGVRRAPHATYALVQTALVMDEALKRANARIEELQAQLRGAGQTRPARLVADFALASDAARIFGCPALSIGGRISPADAAALSHGPGLRLGRVVPPLGRVGGRGHDWL